MKKCIALSVIFLILISIPGCYKRCPATSGLLVPISPYSSPVWHPNGILLGFNHIPVQKAGPSSGGKGCLIEYSVSFFQDSSGFWLINKDGTNMRRVTSFQLHAPAWSPDGKWIAFCDGGNILKMPFDGNNFDTSNIIKLTSDGSNHLFPSWGPSGDTIYYDSNRDGPSYSIFKMGSDGTGQTNIGNKGIDSVSSQEPFCTMDNKIVHIRFPNGASQVFSMDANGNNVTQITNTTDIHNNKEYPGYFNGTIFFQNYGVWSVHPDGSFLKQLCLNSTQGFSISKDGIIAYVDFSNTDTAIVDKTHGAIWLMNSDGSNKRPITYNNY